MIPVFTSKDYGMIASINQTTSGESQWLVVLGLFKKFSISNMIRQTEEIYLLKEDFKKDN